jgi:hypothetical protein
MKQNLTSAIYLIQFQTELDKTSKT